MSTASGGSSELATATAAAAAATAQNGGGAAGQAAAAQPAGSAPAAVLGGSAAAPAAVLGGDPAAAAAAGAPAVSAGPWKYTPASADELAQIPLPDGVLGGKYKTVADLVTGASSAIAQRDGYAEKLKGFSGAPLAEDGKTPKYEFVAPEGFEAELDTKHPLYADMVSLFAEAGANQEFFGRAMGMLTRYSAELGDYTAAETMDELAKVYHTPELRDLKLGELNGYYNPMLDGESRALLNEISLNPKVVQFLDRLKTSMTTSNIPIDIDVGAPNLDADAKRIGSDPKLMTSNSELGKMESDIQAQAARRRR